MLQLPLEFLLPESVWAPPDMADLPSDWRAHRRVSIDCECRDEHIKALGVGVRRGGYVVGVSLAFDDLPSFYLPIRHEGGDNLPEAAVLGYLRHQAARYEGQVCGAHLDYDLDYLAEEGVEFPLADFGDCLVAEPLLDELQFQYGLDVVATRRLGEGQGKDEAMLRQAALAHFKRLPKTGEAGLVKGMLWRLPARYVGAYAERDAQVPLRLLDAQEEALRAEGLWEAWRLECRVLPVLLRMRRRGVRVDVERLARVERYCLEHEAEQLGEVRRLTGVEIPVGRSMTAALCARALRQVGVEVPLTARGQPNIDRHVLAGLVHPVADAIRRARKYAKVTSTYVAGVRDHMTGERLHCTFNQVRRTQDDDEGETGAITYRLSAVHPNLQAQPKRDDELGSMWRSVYAPEDGCLFACPDYSKQEPRWLVHWSVCAGAARIGHAAWEAARAAAAAFHADPRLDPYRVIAQQAGVGYDASKIIYLAQVYGQQEAALCGALGLPTQLVERRDWRTGRSTGTYVEAGPEGKAILDKFNRACPYARAMLRADERQAKDVGYIRSYDGRRCRFERDPVTGKVTRPYRALNKRIQSSSAVQTKLAMVELDRAGHYLQIQVHDEICGSVRDRAEVQAMADVMGSCVSAKVPFRASVAAGPSWGEAK